MKKVLSLLIAALVAVSCTTAVFAKDTDKPVIIAEPNLGTTNADIQKAGNANSKAKADTDAALSKARNDANNATTKARNDAAAATSKAKTDINAEKSAIPAAK
jgi:opacity protein-like surface antigen